MPDHCLKRFRVGGYQCGGNSRHHHHHVTCFFGIATVATDDPQDSRATPFGFVQRPHQVGTHVSFDISTAHRKNEHGILCSRPAGAQPGLEDGRPTFVIRARGQFGNVVTRAVRFDSRQFTKIIDRMGAIGRAAPHSEQKQATAPLTQICQFLRHFLNQLRVQRGGNLPDLIEVRLRVCHSARCYFKSPESTNGFTPPPFGSGAPT